MTRISSGFSARLERVVSLILITGASGAGKATAVRVFEDLAYTVVDNLPPALLPDLVRGYIGAIDGETIRLAVVIDARSGSLFDEWPSAIQAVKDSGISPVILFLDASDAVLVQRFKETRRRHPLFDEHVGILGTVQAERLRLEGLKECADKVIDTSEMDAHDLRNTLLTTFRTDDDPNQGLNITVVSFGFKFGLPLDADLVFDVRFLNNPHYVDELRSYDGRNQLVEEYVMRDKDSPIFLQKLQDMMDFTIPQYVEEGKAYLTIAIGCTGGRHRSVVMAEKLGNALRNKGNRVLVRHRDVNR